MIETVRIMNMGIRIHNFYLPINFLYKPSKQNCNYFGFKNYVLLINKE